MFSCIADFHRAWKEEVEDTLKVLEALPASALDQAVTPAHRDLRRLAQHLVESIVQLPAQMGLEIQGVEVGNLPGEIEGLRRAYGAVAHDLLRATAAWDEAELQKEDTMFGYLQWKRGQSLLALLVHQVHHRGQMTVLMRQAGLKVPEFYGPTKEQWAPMGLPEPVV